MANGAQFSFVVFGVEIPLIGSSLGLGATVGEKSIFRNNSNRFMFLYNIEGIFLIAVSLFYLVI